MAGVIPLMPEDAGEPEDIHKALQKRQRDLIKNLHAEIDPLLPEITNPGADTKSPIYQSWLLKMIQLLRQYGLAAAAIGGAAYTAYRTLVVPSGYTFTPPVPDPIDLRQMVRSLGWATRTVGQKTASGEGFAATKNAVQGTATRLVTDQSRITLIRSVDDDPECRGWYRIPSDPKACAFCRMMCIRGPVYKNAGRAGRNANEKFVGEGQFKFHDHCECTAAPLFTGQKVRQPPYVKQWDRQYTAATKEDPADKLNAFRRVVEDRV